MHDNVVPLCGLKQVVPLAHSALDMARALQKLCRTIEKSHLPLATKSTALVELATVATHLKNAVDILHTGKSARH